MERVSRIENFIPKNDARLLEKAEAAKPVLKERTVLPQQGNVPCSLGAGESATYDFGTHWVGYLTVKLGYSGSHPDAPAYFTVQFAERLSEFEENPAAYRGWISKGWIQTETLHADRLPCVVSLPRRYAFRYVRLTVLDVSRKYRVVPEGIECRAVSAADCAFVPALGSGDEMLDRIDAIAVKTLAECMQDVFEDGPKRDRRLWLGDFRLQALANYATFRNLALVRRCLYLFAGSRFPDDRIAACMFTDGEAAADDTWFSDYALMYPVALAEYCQRSGDKEALSDLYEIAQKQIDLTLSMTGADGIVNEEFVEATFIDWCAGLDKAACAQGVLLYALPYGILLAERQGDKTREARYREALERGRTAAKARFFDGRHCVSNGQISPASAIWMTLGGVLTEAEAREALLGVLSRPTAYPMVSPYLHHYLLEALLKANDPKAAKEHLLAYWGSMAACGADTFFEVWNPLDPDASPYGGKIVNSFCHAWSCTPSYFLRNRLL